MKKSMKFILVLMVCIVTLITFTACNTAQDANQSVGTTDTAAQSSTESAARTYKIGFNNLSTGIDYCVLVEESLKAAAAEAGNVDLIIANCELDTQKALANADAFLLQDVDLIIDFCVVPDTGAAIVLKAAEKGVSVISLDVPYEGAYYYGCNNLESGKVGGRYAGERIISDWGGQIDSLVLTYAEEAGEEVKQRVVGMRLGIEEVLGVEIPEENVFFFDDQNNQPTVTKQIATDFLTAHPDQHHIVFGDLDDPTALGVVAAVESAERQNDVFIISTGGEVPFRENVRKENPPTYWIGSVAYFPEKYGYGLIPYAIAIINGEDAPMQNYMTNIMLTYENIDEYYPE